jgi:hypothetical protein
MLAPPASDYSTNAVVENRLSPLASLIRFPSNRAGFAQEVNVTRPRDRAACYDDNGDDYEDDDGK